MSGCYVYFTRIIPALSVVGIAVLLLLSLVIAPYAQIEGGERNGRATTSQLILAIYTVFLHFLSIFFPARVCWAIGEVMQKIKAGARIAESPKRRKNRKAKNVHFEVTDRDQDNDPRFVIIIPAYKEAIETLEETLRVLASHPRAIDAYHIYLAMEEREEHSACKAVNLVKAFRDSFRKISYTLHPYGIAHEAPGKSSNESWAARQAFKDYSGEIKDNVIITIMDADTHLSSRYFTELRRHHINDHRTNTETIYVPPLVFDRNISKVPFSVRLADIIWAGAGISSFYAGSNVCIPTSVYSLSMTLAELVGGWDTGPDAIGEDMHMYLKCFFALSAKLHCKVIYAAASQCNVSSDVEGLWGYVDGLNARYKQALRHMWGALDSGYAIRQTVAMTSKPRTTNCGITNGSSSMLKPTDATPPIANSPPIKDVDILNVLVLFHRLFEAHFLPVHLGIILIITTAYQILGGPGIPDELALALNISGYCRFIGWSLVCLYIYRYATYHRICVDLRREEMREAGLLDELDEHGGFSEKVFGTLGLAEAALFPLGGFIFGAIPACQAVLSHVFTDRLTYHVSLKPLLCRAGKGKRLEPLRHKSSHVRDRSGTWFRQTALLFDHLGSAFAFSRPVKRKD